MSGRFPTKKRRITKEDKNMKKVMTAAFVLSALAFAATAITAQAEKQTAIPSQAVSAVLGYCTWEGFGDRCCENWLD
jgi:uncharacterized membrane protein